MNGRQSAVEEQLYLLESVFCGTEVKRPPPLVRSNRRAARAVQPACDASRISVSPERAAPTKVTGSEKACQD